MHGREGDVVGDPRRDRGMGDFRKSCCHDIDRILQIVAGVLDPVEVPLHIGLPNASEVVTDRDIEDGPRRFTGKSETPVEGVDQNPCIEVMLNTVPTVEPG